jgi:hypothetical protein
MLSALIDETSALAVREYDYAQELEQNKKLDRIESALRKHVGTARANARMLGATSLFDELPALIGTKAGMISLPLPSKPKESDVETYIANALTLAESTEQNTAYRALTIIESEAVREYDLGHAMAESALRNIPAERQRQLGFRVATAADIAAVRTRALAPEGRMPVLGRMWAAIGDGRTCPECRSKDGALTVLATSFGGASAPLHARCRCTTHMWAVAWESAE